MGWRLFQRDGSLWSSMLHNKYLKNKNIVEVCGKNSSRCSSTWRGITYGINLLLEGGIWRIGDGSSVAFWIDRWIQGMDTLRDHAVCPLDQDKISEKVSCYIENGCWSMVKLRDAIPWNIIQRIMGIQVDTTGEVEDCMIWGNDSEGSFTIKSAYNSFFDKGLGDQWKFDIVWKIRVPPKIQCFLWLVAHGKILTNEQRAIRGIVGDSNCPRCENGCENLEHLFMGCNYSSNIWKDCKYGAAMIRRDAREWKSWFLANLKNKNLFNGLPMCIYFAFTIWYIWKWRCKGIFDPDFRLHPWPHVSIFGAVYDWLVAADKGAKDVEGFENRFISWCPPPSCWVKLNVDGSRNSLGCIAGGGVIRDSNGQWIGGFISNKGIGNVLEAELWGMAEGLIYAWQARFKLVIIEIDCKHIVELLGQEIKRCHPLFNLLHKCKSLIQGDWICRVTHVYREVNMLADWMAKLGLQQALGLKYFEDPPTGCIQILDEDAAGWPVFSVF
ncbi:hypothetical protein ACOSP7_006021 [Xanthoceras sorbifolium]